MISEEHDGRVQPVLIFNAEGNLIGTGLINDKGCRKSIEQGEAWLLDGISGKLLPDPQVRGFRKIVQNERHVEIHADAFIPRPPHEAHAADRPGTEHAQGTGAPPPQTSPKTAPLKEAGTLLAELEKIIYERKRSRPAGSYTTHLFEQGEEKIRKKTGEEAVELILARDNRALASETADLLYHIMVLFAERNMSIHEALRILWERR